MFEDYDKKRKMMHNLRLIDENLQEFIKKYKGVLEGDAIAWLYDITSNFMDVQIDFLREACEEIKM